MAEETKEASDICILDLLNISKPLKKSCFSEQQIDMLFNLWRDFMYEHFATGENSQKALQDVNRLYSVFTTVGRKYDALRLDRATGVKGMTPALPLHEKEWVMGHETPTPFISYLRKRPQVMEVLRMSFKPMMLHSGMLEAPDFVMLLLRYLYWLKDDKERHMNLLGVTEEYSSSGSTTKNMAQNMQQNWSTARFHVAVLNEDVHWRAVLIDRKHHSFEYYDPMGHKLDLTKTTSPLSVQVASLYDAARSLDDKIITKSMHSVRRGFHKHQTGGTECGMYVIMFIHSRVAQQKSFENFAETEISTQDCKDLKEVFFTLPEHLQRFDHKNSKHNKDYLIKFGDYDVRLAALDFVRYMTYVINIADTPQIRQLMEQTRNQFFSEALQPITYTQLRIDGMTAQKIILQVLPTQFKTYAGSDIWFSIIQEIVQDPLTKHLRKISTEHGKRSRNTVRKQVALKMYHEITRWTRQIGAPEAQVQMVQALERDLIDNYYVRMLNGFDSDNEKRFRTGMLGAAFLQECMTRKETTSFGVHFLRELNNFVMNQFHYDTQTELNNKYAVASLVVKPISAKNMAEIRHHVTQCDQVIQQAYELLKNTFTEQMMLTDQVRSPTFGPVALPSQTSNVQLQLVQQIIQLNRQDLENKTFLAGGLQPWNFPVNVPQFNASQSGEILPENFNIYSVNDADMRQLLTSDLFKSYYAMGVLIAQHYIATGALVDARSIHVMLISLVQFYNVTEPFTENRKIICTLLNQMYNAVKSPSVQINGMEMVIDFVSRFHQACVTANDVEATAPFFQKVNAQFKQIFG